MRNNLQIDGKNFQGHMDVGGAYTDITGTLTASAPNYSTTMDGTCFVNVQIYLQPVGLSHYVTAYIDGIYAGYCSCYSASAGSWCTLSFPLRAGQVLKLTATGLTGTQVFNYVIHKYYYKND
jgi:hypothetical protein